MSKESSPLPMVIFPVPAPFSEVQHHLNMRNAIQQEFL